MGRGRAREPPLGLRTSPVYHQSPPVVINIILEFKHCSKHRVQPVCGYGTRFSCKPFPGFNIPFSAVSNDTCGGTLSEFPGWIASPDQDMDGAYDFNTECKWFIQVNHGKVIQLEILYIYLPFPDKCSIDELVSFAHTLQKHDDYTMHI